MRFFLICCLQFALLHCIFAAGPDSKHGKGAAASHSGESPAKKASEFKKHMTDAIHHLKSIMKNLHPFCDKHKATTNVNAHQNEYVTDPEHLKEHKPAEVLDMCCLQVKSKIKKDAKDYDKQLDQIATEIKDEADKIHTATKEKTKQSKGDHERMAPRHGEFMKFMSCTTVECKSGAHCEADQKKISLVHSKFKKVVAKAKGLAAKPVAAVHHAVDKKKQPAAPAKD